MTTQQGKTTETRTFKKPILQRKLFLQQIGKEKLCAVKSKLATESNFRHAYYIL